MNKQREIRPPLNTNKAFVVKKEKMVKQSASLMTAGKAPDWQITDKQKQAEEDGINNNAQFTQSQHENIQPGKAVIAPDKPVFRKKVIKKLGSELLLTGKKTSISNTDKDQQGVKLMPSTVSDINKHKRDEEYFSHLASIVEFSDDAIISKTLDGTIRSWNKGGEKMFGYTASQVIGKNISLIIPQECVEQEKKILEKIRNNETIDHYETIRCKKNGQKFYVSLTVSPLKDPAGNIIGASKIARDITAQKSAEAKLIQANKELVSQNEEKEKRAAELAIANMELAFQNKEKEKRAAELIIANKELAFQNKEKGIRAAELAIANKELIYQNKEKEKRAAELVIANKELAFQNEDKQELAAALIVANSELVFQNKEKEKRAEELESVNRELESFSYSVSHDLRAPLRAINGFTEVLVEDYVGQMDEEARMMLNEVIENSNKMGQLIDNLLEFSRMGKQNVAMIMVDISQIVNTVIAELKQVEQGRIINFTVKNLESILGDRNMLKQVFVNLISNAIKYTGKKHIANIEIGSYGSSNQTIYYVKDNGAGFDMQYYDKLFGVFQRLHSSNEFQGTGVGLAIIQKIITKHNGKVWAVSKVDDGACFYFSLPNTASN